LTAELPGSNCYCELSAVVIVVYSQSAVHEADVSEASSDAISLSAVKFLTRAVQKSEDFSSYGGEAENDDKKFLSVKVELKEHSNSNCLPLLAVDDSTASIPVSCVKIKSENSTDAETDRLKVKDEEPDGEKSAESTENQLPSSESVADSNTERSNIGPSVETTLQLDGCVSVTANVSDVRQPVELEKVCSKTSANSFIENDSCKAAANSARVNVGNVGNMRHTNDCDDSVASSNVSETTCQPVTCDSNTKSADSQCEEQAQSIESKADVATAIRTKCSSPQKSKKLTSKQGTPPDSPGLWCIIYIL